tara:strand:- start:1341 stop:1490 length:150 start_codon:yes stop_codon:yes gene_type:complete
MTVVTTPAIVTVEIKPTLKSIVENINTKNAITKQMISPWYDQKESVSLV